MTPSDPNVETGNVFADLVPEPTPTCSRPNSSAASTPWCAGAASPRPRRGVCSALPSPTYQGS